MTDLDTSTIDNADLHFTDRLAIVAYDLRKVSLWLEGFRDEWDDAGLPAPVFSDGTSGTLRLVVVCFTPVAFDAARRLLSDGAKVDLIERSDEHYHRAGRRFASVVVEAIAPTDLVGCIAKAEAA